MTTDPREHQWEIDELLHRRTDLSTFVIHWTRDYHHTTARDNLVNILASGKIEARNAMGAGMQALKQMQEKGTVSRGSVEKALESQRVVCFTEAPLEQAWSFVCNISGRQNQLEPFGLAFTKKDAREMSINPVWYIDMTPGHDWLTNHVRELVQRAVDRGDFADDPMAKIAPFMEGMGTWQTGPYTTQKEFWWEREWRHLGDLSFLLANVAVVLCPESEMLHVRPYVQSPSRPVPLIDPTWGLEYIIKELAGLSKD